MAKIFLVLWLFVAGYAIINPRHVWEITQGWKARREPPASYFFLNRVIASIGFAIGLFFLFAGFK